MSLIYRIMAAVRRAIRGKDQTGWTTMEYVVGAIALVVVVSTVLGIFKEKLVDAINTLELV